MTHKTFPFQVPALAKSWLRSWSSVFIFSKLFDWYWRFHSMSVSRKASRKWTRYFIMLCFFAW